MTQFPFEEGSEWICDGFEEAYDPPDDPDDDDVVLNS